MEHMTNMVRIKVSAGGESVNFDFQLKGHGKPNLDGLLKSVVRKAIDEHGILNGRVFYPWHTITKIEGSYVSADPMNLSRKDIAFEDAARRPRA